MAAKVTQLQGANQHGESAGTVAGREHSAGSMVCKVRKEWETVNKLRAETYLPRALTFQQAKKLVSATGEKTQGPPAEREQPLPSLFPAGRSDTLLDSRRSSASVVAPRPTPKPRKKRLEEGRPKPTPRPRKRPQRHEQDEKSETLGLISSLKETVETLRKELEVERAVRKKLFDEVISLRRIHQEKEVETCVPSPSWPQGVKAVLNWAEHSVREQLCLLEMFKLVVRFLIDVFDLGKQLCSRPMGRRSDVRNVGSAGYRSTLLIG